MGSIPGESPPDPDEFKVLYGYMGPYYNVANIDGQVSVLGNSLYTWPLSNWKVSGMLRNQTQHYVRVVKVTAHLLGSSGELLGTVTTTPPVTELRPGEPGPFVIDASFAKSKVQSVQWSVKYSTESEISRLFTFNIYEEKEVLGGARYDLVGLIHNGASTTAREVRVVAAWLNEDDRVIYVASPSIRLISNPSEVRDSVDLEGNEDQEFLYLTNDSSLIPVLGQARAALWGTAK